MPPTGRSGRKTTGRSTVDKKGRLKQFLIAKLRERNGLVAEDPNTNAVLSEEADRLLQKAASETELRKAEKRIMRRLEGGSTACSSRMHSEGIATGRSAISHASSVLQDMSTARSAIANPKSMLKNPKEEGGYDYWLRFMEMDVQNFNQEEKKRKAEHKKRMLDNRKFLDEQVAMKKEIKQAARHADLSWGLEIKKDYNKWQEENIVAEAKVREKRERFVKDTDAQMAQVDARREMEIKQDMEFDKKTLKRVQQDMQREKQKLLQKKEEEKKVADLMKVQNAQMKQQKLAQKLTLEQEEVSLQKQYANILLKQELAHKAKQKAFMDEIERKASRFDKLAEEERRKAGEMAAQGEAAEKKAIEDAKEKYRVEMLEAAEKERIKAEKAKRDFKEALHQQLEFKAEQERMNKAETKAQMKELKRELEAASRKEDEKARRVAEANYRNKLAIDAQIREKQRQKEVGRYMSNAEREMNLNLIRKVEHGN